MSKKINIRREDTNRESLNQNFQELFRSLAVQKYISVSHQKWLWNIFCKAICWFIPYNFYFFGGGREYCLSQQVRIILQEREEEWQQTAAASTEMHLVKKVNKTDSRTWSTCNFNAVSTYVVVLLKQLRDLRKRHQSSWVQIPWTNRCETMLLSAFLWCEEWRQRINNHHWRNLLNLLHWSRISWGRSLLRKYISSSFASLEEAPSSMCQIEVSRQQYFSAHTYVTQLFLITVKNLLSFFPLNQTYAYGISISINNICVAYPPSGLYTLISNYLFTSEMMSLWKGSENTASTTCKNFNIEKFSKIFSAIKNCMLKQTHFRINTLIHSINTR